MSKRNKRKNSKAKALAMAAVLAAPSLGCTAGWNSLEQSVNCNDGIARNRLLTNLAAEAGNVEASYHGANQLNDYDGATYNGVNRVFLRKKDGKVKAMVRMLTNKDGVARTMGGVRLPQLCGDAGFIDLSSDKDGANLTIFTVKKVGPNRTVDFLHSQNWAYDGKPSGHSELQYNHGFHPNWQAIVRAEIPNYDHKKTRLMLGARWKK